ncbi:MAG: hypothetical protein HYW25_01020 [Candidatus Aenigmarchaeota archaeon]|nr:hypothetical protein [Candidatus Aenigmarchaeota archaeon]
MAEVFVPLAISLLLGIISLFSDRLVNRFEKYHEELMSLSAGILITIILMAFIGVIAGGADIFGSIVYLYLAMGFVIFHTAEKYVYKHVPSSMMKHIRKELNQMHLFGFAVDHIIMGMFLVMLWFLHSLTVLYILVVPFIIHVVASAHPIRHLGMKLHELWTNITLALSIPFGSLVALFLLGHQEALYSVFALITGTLLYIVVRDVTPKYRKGNIYWFLIGFLITAAVQVILV